MYILVAEQLLSLGSYTQDDMALSMSVYDLDAINEEVLEAEGDEHHDNIVIVSGTNISVTIIITVKPYETIVTN